MRSGRLPPGGGVIEDDSTEPRVLLCSTITPPIAQSAAQPAAELIGRRGLPLHQPPKLAVIDTRSVVGDGDGADRMIGVVEDRVGDRAQPLGHRPLFDREPPSADVDQHPPQLGRAGRAAPVALHQARPVREQRPHLASRSAGPASPARWRSVRPGVVRRRRSPGAAGRPPALRSGRARLGRAARTGARSGRSGRPAGAAPDARFVAAAPAAGRPSPIRTLRRRGRSDAPRPGG